VITVLLQSGKGGGLGAGFGGGGANTLFGSTGGSNFFTNLTMGLAFVFMVTSISLTVIKNKSLRTSIFDQGSAPLSAPATPGTPAAPEATAPTAAAPAMPANSSANAEPAKAPEKK
jgi:preprotein translocase subunit SecG